MGGVLKNILFRRSIKALCLCPKLLGKLKGRCLIYYSEVASGKERYYKKKERGDLELEICLSRNAINRVWTDTPLGQNCFLLTMNPI